MSLLSISIKSSFHFMSKPGSKEEVKIGGTERSMTPKLGERLRGSPAKCVV